MDRNEIVRTDFTSSRKGYAREEVDRHLKAVAAELARVQQERERSASLAGSTADRVREILEAAERSATDISSKAEDDAQRAAERNEAAVRAAREKAVVEIQEHSKRVDESLDRALERAKALEADFERTAETLRSNLEGLVADLGGGVDAVRAQLDDVRGSLPEVQSVNVRSGRREARPEAEAVESGRERKARDRKARDRKARDRVVEPPKQESAKETGSWAGPRTAAAEPETAEQTAVSEPKEGTAKRGSTPEGSSAEKAGKDGAEGARMIALNMALKGTPRDQTARYLASNFELEDPDAVVEDVYSRVQS
jgi:hypothetical protein